jgi:hypothetical protein
VHVTRAFYNFQFYDSKRSIFIKDDDDSGTARHGTARHGTAIETFKETDTSS